MLSTENMTLVIVLIFVLLVLGMILLPAASFIRLVGLIRSNGSKVDHVKQEVQQVRTILSDVTANGIGSNGVTDTRTMPEDPSTLSTGSTPETKYQKS